MLWLFHFTLNSLVSISPSEASSWCLSTYMLHLDRAFSLGVDTLTALGMIGCMTVSNSKLEVGLWSTHFSPPAECERLCMGWTGRAVWWPQGEEDKSESYSHSMTVGLIGKADHQNTTDWAENMYCWCVGVMDFMEKNEKVIKSQPASSTQLWTEIFFFFIISNVFFSFQDLFLGLVYVWNLLQFSNLLESVLTCLFWLKMTTSVLNLFDWSSLTEHSNENTKTFKLTISQQYIIFS